ncbi:MULTISPECIES: hypothetical protein [unclassified Roseateles]|uniref:hypothetical protein n=1 Tax=unclassified Roseateles TaxID=2626991 RepID=UPI0012E38C26|nr:MULTISPECIES: hypothetical protein [unclassified Roseateles]
MNGFATKRCAALAVLVTCAGAANAVYVVDTGQPAYTGVGSTSSPIGSVFDGTVSTGGTFSISSSTTISAIQGFMVVYGGGNLAVSLHAGSPTGPLLFSAQKSVAWPTSFPYEWVGIDGLNWTVPAGTYGFTIGSPDWFSASMPWGAPMPLGEEWQGFNGGWNRSDEMDLGFRVSAVPEAATHALLGAGLALIFALRVRRKV